MVNHTVDVKAADPKTGMTLDELAVFVQEAMRAGIAGDTPVKAVVSMRGGIKKLETRT